jgi:hypothetical protein
LIFTFKISKESEPFLMNYDKIYKEITIRVFKEGVIIRKKDTIKFFEAKEEFYEDNIKLFEDEEILFNVVIDADSKIYLLIIFYVSLTQIFSKFNLIFKNIIYKNKENSIKYGKLLVKIILQLSPI